MKQTYTQKQTLYSTVHVIRCTMSVLCHYHDIFTVVFFSVTMRSSVSTNFKMRLVYRPYRYVETLFQGLQLGPKNSYFSMMQDVNVTAV